MFTRPSADNNYATIQLFMDNTGMNLEARESKQRQEGFKMIERYSREKDSKVFQPWNRIPFIDRLKLLTYLE